MIFFAYWDSSCNVTVFIKDWLYRLDDIGGGAKGLVSSPQEKAQTQLLKQQAERERIRQLWRQGKIA